MSCRSSDAFMELADFAHEILRIIDEGGTDRSHLTVGKVELKPGAAHAIPGEAVFLELEMYIETV